MPAPTFDNLLLFSFCLVKTMKIKTSCILNQNFKRLFFLLILRFPVFQIQNGKYIGVSPDSFL